MSMISIMLFLSCLPGVKALLPASNALEKNDMNHKAPVVTDHQITIYLTELTEYIRENGIDEFYITGADATACVKSTCFNMAKAGYTVHVISDCVTSYDLKKMHEMLSYYAEKGCEVKTLAEYMGSN